MLLLPVDIGTVLVGLALNTFHFVQTNFAGTKISGVCWVSLLGDLSHASREFLKRSQTTLDFIGRPLIKIGQH